MSTDKQALARRLGTLPLELATIFHDDAPDFGTGHCMSCLPCHCPKIWNSYAQDFLRAHSAHNATKMHKQKVANLLWGLGLTTEEFREVWKTLANGDIYNLPNAEIKTGETFDWCECWCFTTKQLAEAVKTVISQRNKGI